MLSENDHDRQTSSPIMLSVKNSDIKSMAVTTSKSMSNSSHEYQPTAQEMSELLEEKVRNEASCFTRN